MADNHNSVNGIREYCKRSHAAFEYVPIRYDDLRIDQDVLEDALSKSEARKHKLFAFPAQSNVSGVQHHLSWIKKAQAKGWDVLLDAAAYAPSSKLDLSEVNPNFVSISFYKIFGYPTGLGCLLMHKDSFELLEKKWFAGGTVTLASVMAPHHYLAGNHERFENGTINYLDIPALSIGIDYINQIGIERIHERVVSLSTYLFERLTKLTHANHVKKLKLFGPQDRNHVGGTLIMTFLTENGVVIPFEEVEQKANNEMISLRSGCFCNPGIDEVNNCLTMQELSQYFTSRTTGDYYDMIATLKKMRGAIRVSVGLATTQHDLDRFIDFVKQF
ncbi:hypothetical protein GCM10009117_14340 [Gangjinia marincola]|uniref:Aminotransferase class V domain-containing protein n=1 Tax=Gangjinia marincola TaxID=578463 RepID=A0ABN1MH43_9FLAO